jgi:hypothetical protein
MKRGGWAIEYFYFQTGWSGASYGCADQSHSREPFFKPSELNNIGNLGFDPAPGLTSRAGPAIFEISDLAPM